PLLPSPPASGRGEKEGRVRFFIRLRFYTGKRRCRLAVRRTPDRLAMTDAPLNHPGDETLLALSLGQLAEAELLGPAYGAPRQPSTLPEGGVGRRAERYRFRLLPYTGCDRMPVLVDQRY